MPTHSMDTSVIASVVLVEEIVKLIQLMNVNLHHAKMEGLALILLVPFNVLASLAMKEAIVKQVSVLQREQALGERCFK